MCSRLSSISFRKSQWVGRSFYCSFPFLTIVVPYSRKCLVRLPYRTFEHFERFQKRFCCLAICQTFTTDFGEMAETTGNSSEYDSHVAKILTQEEIEIMRAQNSRLVSEFRANQLEKDAKKYWDLFYKRNDTRFFKDRHWTTREFDELLAFGSRQDQNVLLEVGCGVGNFLYPLIEDGLKFEQIFACDLSSRAVDLTKNHPRYDSEKMKIFQTDITTENCFSEVHRPVNVATLIFVLSAIHPEKFRKVVHNLYKVLDNGGLVLFRDYGLYDMAQFRFKAGHKIGENYYTRQDGTRTYYFSVEEVSNLFENAGFRILKCDYVQRRTVNPKEKIDVPRIFLQGKFQKTR